MPPASPQRYTAAQLGQLSGVGERTVRYYVRERLIDPPDGRGRGAHFDDRHLSQLGYVRLLQEAGLDHAAIRRHGAELEAILAKRGVACAAWEKSWAGASLRIVQAYRRLKAKQPAAAITTATRVAVAPGIELIVDSSRRLPPPAKLAELVELVRAAFATRGDGNRPAAR
ncbi:MAG: MerR family transcriptional regulator [Alphaproteobacteria bacterium]|nr:MerR family transcriptional regulator [Alphaproteobacteria bacterium]